MAKKSYGEEFFKKLSLYEPLSALRDSPDCYHMNIFMLAVRNGDKQLVETILNLVDDIDLKKEILQQALQYRGDEHQLLFKPILDLAIDSKSAALVDFLMSAMDDIGILPDIALNHTRLVSTKEHNMNLLKKAIAVENMDIINVILKYRKKLGLVFYTYPDQSYPNYILADMNITPILLTPILNISPNIFEKVLDETIQDL